MTFRPEDLREELIRFNPTKRPVENKVVDVEASLEKFASRGKIQDVVAKVAKEVYQIRRIFW